MSTRVLGELVYAEGGNEELLYDLWKRGRRIAPLHVILLFSRSLWLGYSYSVPVQYSVYNIVIVTSEAGVFFFCTVLWPNSDTDQEMILLRYLYIRVLP